MTDKEKVKARTEFLYRTKYLPAYLLFIALYPFGLEDLPGELWKWIAGYEGLYKISNFGRVKSFPRQGASTEFKIRKPILTKRGYLQICLYKGCKEKAFKIHRLVAEAFIPNPENKPEVNHKYGMKFDCYFENLEWATPKENMKHAMNTGLSPTGTNRNTAKLTKEDVKFIREHYIPRHPKFGAAAFARRFNVLRSSIQDVIKGKSYKNID